MFSVKERTKWSWLEMVAQLHANTMELVVCGPDGDRSRGLVCCQVCPCPNSHDHQSQVQRKTRDKTKDAKRDVKLQRRD